MRPSSIAFVLLWLAACGPAPSETAPIAVPSTPAPLPAVVQTITHPSGDLEAETRELLRALGRLAEIARHADAGGTLTARLAVAEEQLDHAAEALKEALSSTGEPRRHAASKALLRLRSAPLTLSLFALDVPLLARRHAITDEAASRLEAEARALRQRVESAGVAAEQLLF